MINTCFGHGSRHYFDIRNFMKKKKTTKGKQRQEREVVYGAHSIIELLKAGRRKLLSLYTTKPLPRSWKRIEQYLPKSVPNIQYVTRNVLSSMAKSHEHMGVVALVSPFKFRSKPFDAQKQKFILLLDGIQDVGNLGGILRTAYCTGVDGVVLCRKGAAPLTAAAIKASAGLAEHLDIYLASSAHEAVLMLKKAGYRFYSAVLQGGKNALEVEYQRPMCLIIGNEAVGVAPDIREKSELITLPQRSADISYNASVAAGILMFTLAYRK